jgi:hypothetical protein
MTLTKKDDLVESLILSEVEGKNRAIHAYDGIVWKIRTGFLTLLFGGWAILLQGILNASVTPKGGYGPLVWGLFLFSVGFTFGAWFMDRSYVRRKFRVIHTLNQLTDSIVSCGRNYSEVNSELLHVAGDSAQIRYQGDAYKQATRAELIVYLVPLLILLAVIVLSLSDTLAVKETTTPCL